MAYDFNGSNQWMNNDTFSHVTNFPYSLACFVNLDTAGDVVAVGLTKTSANPGSYITPRLSSSLVAAGTYNGSSASLSLAGSSYSTNTWHHIVGVYSSSTSRLVYFDGVAGTTNTVNLLAADLDRINIGAIKFGTTAVGNYLNGRIAEAAIWDVVLTAAEAASLAKGFKPSRVRPQSLKFYCPLVRAITDNARAVTLTNNNTATVATHTRVY